MTEGLAAWTKMWQKITKLPPHAHQMSTQTPLLTHTHTHRI